MPHLSLQHLWVVSFGNHQKKKKKKSHLIFESSFLHIQEYLWISEESFILKLCEIMKYNLDKQPPFNIFKPGALKTFSLQENTMPRVKVIILCLVTILLFFAHYKFSLNTIEVLVEKRKKKIYYMTFWKRQIYDYHKNGNHISNYQDLQGSKKGKATKGDADIFWTMRIFFILTVVVVITLQMFVKFTVLYTPERMCFTIYKYYLNKQKRKDLQNIKFILIEGFSCTALKQNHRENLQENSIV